jgi:4-aminobutyrate aminotransferase-like enzyme
VVRDVRGLGLMIGVEFAEHLGYSFANDVSQVIATRRRACCLYHPQINEHLACCFSPN